LDRIEISPSGVEQLRRKIASERDSYCSGLFLSARWFVLSQVAGKGVNVVILPDKESAEYCAADLYGLMEGDCVFFLPDSGKSVEKSNYKSSLSVQRTAAIGKLMASKSFSTGKTTPLVVVTYPEAIEEGITALENIKSVRIGKGDTMKRDALVETLTGNGFERVEFVSLPGQFAIRGSIVDVFSYSNNNPYRISYFGNDVEKIAVFDCNTQLSLETVDSMEVVPDIGGSEDVSVMEILPEDCIVWLDSSDMYRDKGFFAATAARRRVFMEIPLSEKDVDDVHFMIEPQPVFNKNFELLTEDIRKKILGGYKVYIYGEKESQLSRVREILSQNDGLIPDFVQGSNIHSGFIDEESKTCCYSDHEIFDRFQRVTMRRTVEKSEQLTINDLNAFRIGDYIVHIDHGVGIFGGLVNMTDSRGRVHEVVKLIYKDGDVVFVSVHALNKISRYKSKDAAPPRINKLGSKTWQVLKNSAKSKVKDIAKDLIQLYAKRKSSKGFAFSADTYLQKELESSFMYEDTPDQMKATEAVKRDMEDGSPMDRLVCGDVGFGKTEVAIRAAFKAVTDSKQVAVLVPTTILALQHFETFKARLKDFPCSIDYVSRLRTAKEISDIRERLATGSIDILIGTHKILGKGFEFKNLGLLIIDEEQKFGVSAKEKLRQMKVGVDTLTLTATPIPRTLQFSLLGARDLSIISTPPANRIPVQTEIMNFDEKEIKSIIDYEIRRGGQIFFLHNKVDELPSIHDMLRRIEPDMKIVVAHGQMEAKELEDRMLGFIRGDFDMLLCTTIIENGLDIPNANTIIINQAQNFGLSDLHQLRGRVGRSNKKAFCYLIVPPLTTLSDDSRRRLKAIEEYSDLGSGFNIAMQDLDIRGAGNLLGAEQSGFIADMGYETYQKILSEAMEELGVETGMTSKNLRGNYVEDCTIETDEVALIPDSYISNPSEKLAIYRKLDSMPDDAGLDKMSAELADRFGTVPDELNALFDIVRIRHIGERNGFERIIIKNGILIAHFISNQMSPYYSSKEFERVMKSLTENASLFEFKQDGGRLKIVSRGVDTISNALDLLRKL